MPDLSFLSPFIDPISTHVVPLLKKIPKRAWIIIGSVAATVVLLIIGFVGGQRYDERAEKPVASTYVGGLDLAQHCISYGFTGVNGLLCISEINLDQACNWQYKQTGMQLRFSRDDPYSGVCYKSENEPVGGIKDMPGYCRESFPTSNEVRPAVVNLGDKKTWVCQAPIDMRIACIWQYQLRDVQPRKVDENWACYK
ncbi:hypothetical protein [Nocardia inohanensis]|uniref:hypothetical protein n=1 Tax=Nocardia inohanensis TaxID=209246 RepID=UPI000833CB25|nr:hypothetical protein [Nocardia inohanensis]